MALTGTKKPSLTSSVSSMSWFWPPLSNKTNVEKDKNFSLSRSLSSSSSSSYSSSALSPPAGSSSGKESLGREVLAVGLDSWQQAALPRVSRRMSGEETPGPWLPPIFSLEDGEDGEGVEGEEEEGGEFWEYDSEYGREYEMGYGMMYGTQYGQECSDEEFVTSQNQATQIYDEFHSPPYSGYEDEYPMTSPVQLAQISVHEKRFLHQKSTVQDVTNQDTVSVTAGKSDSH